MAASIYATPPPNFSEEVALSDASNSSQLSNRSSTGKNKSTVKKRSFASLILTSNNNNISNNDASQQLLLEGQTEINSSSPTRRTSLSSNSPIDSQTDQSKKRRKQTTPIRISGSSATTLTVKQEQFEEEVYDVLENQEKSNENNKIKATDDGTHFKYFKFEKQKDCSINNEITDQSLIIDDSEENCNKREEDQSRIENFKEITNTTLKSINRNFTINISAKTDKDLSEYTNNLSADFVSSCTSGSYPAKSNSIKINQKPFDDNTDDSSLKNCDQNYVTDFNNIDFCKQCGEKFDTELQLSIHVLQSHTTIPKEHVIEKLLSNNNNDDVLDPKDNNNVKNNERTTTLSEIKTLNTNDPDRIQPVQVKLENSDSESDPETLNFIAINHKNLSRKRNNNDKIKKQMSSPLSGTTETIDSLENTTNSGRGNQNNFQSTRPTEEWLSSISNLGFPFSTDATAAAAFSASNYLSQLPLLGGPTGVGGFNSVVDGLSRPPIRIFNPEAYCDLCNKEFCNKYFLKTHKANKHGIYDPVSSTNENSGTSVSNHQINQLSQVLQMQFNQQHQQQFEHQTQLQQQHPEQKAQKSSNELSPQQSTQSQHQQQQTPSPNHQQQCLNASQYQLPPQSVTPLEITVFCDICNKRFTNIFAMKRHRTKAHENTASPISSASTMPQNNSSANIDTKSPNASSNPINLHSIDKKQSAVKTQQNHHQPLSVLQQTQTNLQKSNCNNKSNEGCTINFSKDKDPSNSLQEQHQSLQIPEGFKEDFSLEQEEVSFTPQPRKLSPLSIQQAKDANFSFDKLKRLGVINPEAFCDLCCKEYCNKYFLRTHKLKRHGIFIPNDDLGSSVYNMVGSNAAAPLGKENENNIFQPSTPLWTPFVQQMQQQMQQMQMHMHQATPLNLMMAAAAVGVTPTNKIMRRQSQDYDEDSQRNFNKPDTIKKIRLDNIENEKTPNIYSCKINDEKEKLDDGNNKDQFIENTVKINNKNEISENLSQLMQEGLVNAAAAFANHDSDIVGLDLQKLQSMILQLNDLNSQKTIACQLCGKDMKNQLHLQAHIAAKHFSNTSNNLNDDNNQLRHQIETTGLTFKSQLGFPSQQSSPNDSDSPEICKQCDREFPGVLELKQHIIEYHGLMLNSPIREGFITPERSIPGSGSLTAPSTPNQIDRKPLYTVTPTSSYCEICNKELCNKYFMKTHMQRMHGIEIENGAQIGGVVCNICNKELCSKYFLRVHKTNSHGIVDEGSPTPGPMSSVSKFDETTKNLFEAFESKSTDLSDLGVRYFTHYTEVCPLCNRRFRSSKWLRAHLMSDHGKAGVEKLQELAQSMIFSKPNSPLHFKIQNNKSMENESASENVTPTISDSNILMSTLNNLDTALITKSTPLPNLFIKTGVLMADEPQLPSSPSSASNPTGRFQDYQCSFCSFTTPYYAFLFIHERSHTILSTNAANQNFLLDGQNNQVVDVIDSKNSTTNLTEESSSHLTNPSETLSRGELISPPMMQGVQTPQLFEKENDNNMKKKKDEKKDTLMLSETIMTTEEFKVLECASNITPKQTALSETDFFPSRTNGEKNARRKEPKNEKQDNILEKLTHGIDSNNVTKNISESILNISKVPCFEAISHLANFLNRPVSYALPQNDQGELMQSFLIEEQQIKSSPSVSISEEKAGENRETIDQVEEVVDANTKIIQQKMEINENVKRFVPAVVFLPVKERVAKPITVSFTLTPA